VARRVQRAWLKQGDVPGGQLVGIRLKVGRLAVRASDVVLFDSTRAAAPTCPVCSCVLRLVLAAPVFALILSAQRKPMSEMDDFHHPEPVNRRKLTKSKSKPPVSFNNKGTHSLRRNPSAPTYPSFHASDRDGSTSAPRHDSSAPSIHALRRQLSTSQVSAPHYNPPQQLHPHHPYSAASSQDSLRSTPLDAELGQPWDIASITANIAAAQAAVAGSSNNNAQRPALPHSHTHTQTTDAPKKLKSPLLRQSASISGFRQRMETITPPRSDGGAGTATGTNSPRQRWSGEGADASKAKKKSTFSQFFKLGSPRRPTISTPTNPMHVTHVSIDNETGEFTVCATSPLQFPAMIPR
jgi:p21-activated kinase 1